MSEAVASEADAPEKKSAREKSIFEKVFDFFSSFGLACVTMSFLCLLTFVGTMDMGRLGLHETGNRYFESIIAYYEFGNDLEQEALTGDGGGKIIPMPGGMLLMVLLFINLLCGAIIRARKNPKRPGMLIAHSGMLFMLIAGLVSFTMMKEGNLPLWEESEFGAEFEPAIGGARVTAVKEGSSAAKAGLEVGDLVVSVTKPGGDDELGTKDDETETITDYRQEQYGMAAERFAAGRAGDIIEVAVERGGEEKSLRATFSGESGNESFNLTNWSIEIGDYTDGKSPEKVTVIPPRDLAPLLKKGSKRVFFSKDLPFEIEIYNYVRHTDPLPVTDIDPGLEPVDGFYLLPIAKDPNEELNFRGCNIRILPKGGGKPLVESILYADYPGQNFTAPLTIDLDGRRWAINLTKEKTTLPFKLRLEKFRKIDHARVSRVKEFTSDVTKFDADGSAESGVTSLIEMNKPLRSDGFTVYQAGWGPPGAEEGDLLYTNLVIARNPADQWPKYACYIVTFGLVFHFAQKLYFYINRMARKRRRIQEANTAEIPHKS